MLSFISWTFWCVHIWWSTKDNPLCYKELWLYWAITFITRKWFGWQNSHLDISMFHIFSRLYKINKPTYSLYFNAFFPILIYCSIELNLKVFRIWINNLTIFFTSGILLKPTVSMSFHCMVKSKSYCLSWHRQKKSNLDTCITKNFAVIDKERKSFLLLEDGEINFDW